MISDHIKAITRLEEDLERNGIPVTPSSRIRLVRKRLVLSQLKTIHEIREDADLLRKTIHALREAHQLSRIAGLVRRGGAKKGWQGEALRLSKGRELPQAEQHSIGRDTQFHMLVAADFESAGYFVRFGEPDLLIGAPARPFSIAAKRPRSRSNLHKVLCGGRDQVTASPHSGLLAVDVTSLVNPDNLLATATSLASGMGRADGLMDVFGRNKIASSTTGSSAREFLP